MNKVLIVEDEPAIAFGIRTFLTAKGWEVHETDSCAPALEMFSRIRPDAALIDYSLPDGNALELLPKLKAIDPNVPVFVLTGHGTIDLAVKAIKEGAEHFITKPIELSVLSVMLERAMDKHRQTRREIAANQNRQHRRVIDPFLGVSENINKLARQVRKVARTDTPILIQGETGTGKSVLAGWLHVNSPRTEEPFVELNCAGLAAEFLQSELFGHEKGSFTGAVNRKLGLLEVAHRGTLFLDEIGDIDLQIQPKLLKALEEKKFRRLGAVTEMRVDIRLIAASNQNLGELVQEKKFRGDLYYRINTIRLIVPPLRERREDIPILAADFLERFAADMKLGKVKLTPEAERALRDYSFPGNIRELRNILERALLMSDDGTVRRDDLFFESSLSELAEAPVATTHFEPAMTLEEIELWHIQKALRDENGNVIKVAGKLGISRSSLYQKIKRYDIDLSKL